jgi:hypothetical protein
MVRMVARRATRLVPLFIVLFIWGLTTHGKYSDSGDEPHYLIVAESLASDGDLDLSNNYFNGDARWFGADDLVPLAHAARTRHGALWSTHDVGLPVLVAPVYALAMRASRLVPDPLLARMRQTRGLFAYSLVSFTMVVATAFFATLFMRSLMRHTTVAAAAGITLLLVLSPPVLSHAFLVFPETPALWVTCAFVWLIALPGTDLTRGRVLSVMAAIGAMPWLHRKYSLYCLALAIVVVITHREWLKAQPRAWLALAGLAAVAPQAALHATTMWAWGHLGGPQMLGGLPFKVTGGPKGALGLLFDRERGLLGYAPVYLLAPVWWGLAWREHRALLLPIACLFIPMSMFVTWDAGFSPAARFLVPLLPLVLLPAVRAFGNRRFISLAIPVLVFQAIVTALAWQFPRRLWPREQGTNQILDVIPVVGPVYSSWLPSVQTDPSLAHAWLAAAALGMMTLGAILVCRRTHRSTSAASTGR